VPTVAAPLAHASPDPAHGVWRRELTDLVRAASGGLLFGVPLLYTMEVWWVGTRSAAGQLALVVVLLALPLFGLNMAAGFRSSPDARVRDAMGDTVEALAIGIVVSLAVLVLLREIDGSTPVAEGLGKVLYEAVPFCLGIGVARHFLHGQRASVEDDDNDDSTSGRALNRTVADLGATSVGAVFIALSIAPTDELPMIASAMSPMWVLVLLAASLVASYAIVFVAGFVGQDSRRAHEGVAQRPISETVLCYLISLVVSALLLWLFQRGGPPYGDYLTRTIVLGLPAAVGGAAGRLAV
jgi:putative integral membrane protein (TIGR02587 family)